MSALNIFSVRLKLKVTLKQPEGLAIGEHNQPYLLGIIQSTGGKKTCFLLIFEFRTILDKFPFPFHIVIRFTITIV